MRGALIATAAAVLTGCGTDGVAVIDERPSRERSTPLAAVEPGGRTEPAGTFEPASCPPELAGCEVASGTILYVERKDPDGDGDAHFVLRSKQSITARGLSVIDVRADLRPRPLPRPGEQFSGAGLVQRGSFGQRQIEAVAVGFER